MHGYWTFDLAIPAPARTPPATQRLLVVFCATEAPDEVGVTEAIVEYCERTRPPDEIVLLAPATEEAALRRLIGSDKFTGRLRDITRYVDTPGAVGLLFSAAGVLTTLEGRPPRAGLARAIPRRGLTRLVRSYPVLREALPAFHFVLPSGEHAPAFFRIGSAMADGAAIDFAAFCCLPFLPAELRNIYCDSGTIIPVAYAISALRKRFNPTSPAPCIRSFKSYEGLRAFEFRDVDRSVVLLSLTITGGLPARIHNLHGVPPTAIVSLFALRDLPRFPRVVCDLRWHKDNDEGFRPVDTHPADACQLCASSSTPIQIAGEHFLTSQIRVEPLILRDKHAPPWLSPFMEDAAGKRLIRANYKSMDSGHATREVFFDLERLYGDPGLLGMGHYRKRFQWALSRAVPAALTRIVHLDSPASRVMAERIATEARGRLPAAPQVLAYQAVRDRWREHVTDAGATLVVAGAAASGRSLLSVAQLLRRIQTNGAITYLVGLSRFESKEAAAEVETNVTYGDEPKDYGFFSVERVFLPLVGGKAETSWDLELDLINRLLVGRVDDARRTLEERSTAIRTAADHAVRGMLNDLFWPRPTGEALTLRPNFAFFDFPYTPETGVSQADVFFTMLAILHSLRSARDDRDSLYPHEHVRRVLAPRCFDRFNDGVIQSSLLRAAHRAELDYSTDANLSSEMWKVLDFIFQERTSEPGEACREFLLSLALGRLRLRPEDTARLRDRHAAATPDPVEMLLWQEVSRHLREGQPPEPVPEEAPPAPTPPDPLSAESGDAPNAPGTATAATEGSR